MTNADKFKSLFGLYATELWAMPEKDFLKWLNSEATNCSEFPNNSDTISRQAAIDAVKRLSLGETDATKLAMRIGDYLKRMKSAQPDHLVDVSKKGDMISRKAVFYALECMRFASDAERRYAFSMLGQIPIAQPERPEQPESAKEYCAECDHIEMCRWYPWEGCEFRSLPSAQPEITLEQIEEYCRPRCLSIITNDLLCHLEQRQPKRTGEWIPCSQKLPGEGYSVLITREPFKIKGYEQEVIKAKRSVDPRSGEIEWWSPEFGTLTNKAVLAWMPLPEPYKESDTE